MMILLLPISSFQSINLRRGIMKKFLALLGICCLLLFTLSACGGNAPKGETEQPAAEQPAAPTGEQVGQAADQAQETAGEAADTAQESAGEAEEATK
jgi:predicted small lipoprotein YifL